MNNTNNKEQVADSNGAQIEENYTINNDFTVKDSKKIENVEWAFQFNNEEPRLLATTNGDTKKLTLTIGNHPDSIIVFTDYKGNEFKIFARESESDADKKQNP